MKFVFFGTPDFAAIILEKLIQAGWPPTLVICNPDKPLGRKQVITPPPTKVVAQKYNIPIWQPEKLEIGNSCLPVGMGELEIGKFDGIEFAVLAAYAKILPAEIIKMLPRGIIGIHPSLLPKYRGATPIQTTLLNGESLTGTTLFLMDEKVDHGPVLAQTEMPIAEDDNFTTLSRKLADLSAELLVKTLPAFTAGEIKAQPQIHDLATYTKKIVTEDGLVDLTKDDELMIRRKIKALNPNPGVYTIKGGVRIKILDLQTIQYESKKTRVVGDAISFLRGL